MTDSSVNVLLLLLLKKTLAKESVPKRDACTLAAVCCESVALLASKRKLMLQNVCGGKEWG